MINWKSLELGLRLQGEEFGQIMSHAIINQLTGEKTCFVCADLQENHNRCRRRACGAQLQKYRIKHFQDEYKKEPN